MSIGAHDAFIALSQTTIGVMPSPVQRDASVAEVDIEGMDVPAVNDPIAGSRYRPGIAVIGGSLFFQTGKPEHIGLSGQVCDTCVTTDRTISNLIPERR